MTVISTADTGQSLSAGDVMYLTSSGSITSPSGAGFLSLSANVGVVIAGSVMAQNGVLFTSPNLDSNSFVRLAATGSIDAHTYGIAIGGNTTFDIENSGSIIAGQYAVFLDNSDGTGPDVIRNFGVMRGTVAAISVAPGFPFHNGIEVLNDGVLFGTTAAVDLANATTDVVITNNGLIDGDVVTGAGSDNLVTTGRIHGSISTNGGDDFVDTSEGLTRRVSIDLGVGDDFVVLGAGRETVEGGDGYDVVSYNHSDAIVLNLLHPGLNRGDAAADRFSGIEVFYGSGEGDDRMTGGTGADSLRGLGGDDSLLGGAGADSLAGGAGADRLTGGTGNDSFVFFAPDEGSDRITDFSKVAGNRDHLVFNDTGFGLGLPGGALDSSHFVARADTAAQTAEQWFVYRTTDHSLWFDADGTGPGAAVLLATFTNAVTLGAADIVIEL